ncbi:hydrolase [Longispora fulva]|uniref:Pimeloyl-ACP methyl ester carboxylesterase n=1 Tax=Longispora fulva TaxID=619741 RepID=A0A8J7GET2_9ACTN|nr:alpha/beta hydrolase [Longispora fulva]MBG6139308.1 pimeloyl-ACP methyl ester carboxylesterase [Longispora fulva]GIG58805.1 hydrolase [Longispora fulva]
MPLPLHITVWDQGASDATPVVFVHGTLNWGTLAFQDQRPLSRYRRLLVPDRRGFGASPDLEGGAHTSDHDVDAEDVVTLLGEGAHLVGHSYGGVVALLAAARRPDLVRSLALIEPAAHQVAADRPVVAAAIAAGRESMAGARRATAEEYLEVVFGDRPRPGPADWLLRAAHTALHERPCWLADIPTEPLAGAAFPKLVVTGAWDVDVPGYWPGMGVVMKLVGEVVADRIGGRLVRVAGAAHEVQREQPDTTNALLTDLWAISG